MTLIVGYIYKNDVHVFSDSATKKGFLTTKSISPLKKTSSFEEAPIINNSSIIEEADQKIYNFENKIILTFSGEVKTGQNVLEDLIIRLSLNPTWKVSDILTDYFDVEKPSNVSFIIGFYEESKGTMFVYQDVNKYEFTNQDTAFVAFGSGSIETNLISPLKVAIRGFIATHQPTSEAFNVAIVSILQSSSIYTRSMQIGVGGFFNGAFISDGSVFWSADVIYILCSRNLFRKYEKYIIHKYNVLDSVFISSNSGSFIHVPESFWFGDKIFSLDDDLRQNLMAKKNNNESDYFSVVTHDKYGAVIIKRHEQNEKNHITLESLDTQSIKFSFSSFIESNITTPPKNPKTDLLDDSDKMIKMLFFKQNG